MRGIAPEHTLGAVDGLRRFEKPAIVLWGLRDVFFKVADGRRLVDTLPQARLETVEAARTFVQLDAPERVAELVRELHRRPPRPRHRDRLAPPPIAACLNCSEH